MSRPNDINGLMGKIFELYSDAMTVTKDLVKNLFLAAGGRGDICLGGGGSDNELTNWDGTRKRNGWGR